MRRRERTENVIKAIAQFQFFMKQCVGRVRSFGSAATFLKKIACVLFDTQTVNLKFAEVMDARMSSR